MDETLICFAISDILMEENRTMKGLLFLPQKNYHPLLWVRHERTEWPGFLKIIQADISWALWMPSSSEFFCCYFQITKIRAEQNVLKFQPVTCWTTELRVCHFSALSWLDCWKKQSQADTICAIGLFSIESIIIFSSTGDQVN